MVIIKGVDTRFKAVEVANAVGQGTVSDHDRWIKGDDSGTKRYVKVDANGRLETIASGGTVTVGDIGRIGTIGVIESGTVNVSNMPSDYMKQEDDYDFQSYDLNTTRASPGSTLVQAGESLTVFELSGSCSLRFNGTAKPAILVNELTYPQMVVFERTYTNVYLQNTSQSGKTAKLYFGKRT